MEARKFVSKHFPWLDALPKVTGEARYVADIDLSGMVYGKLLRSQLVTYPPEIVPGLMLGFGRI